MEHTPTPWALRPDHPKWKHYTEFRNDIVKPNGELLLTCYPANEESAGHKEAEANAALIVSAVNSHDELVGRNKRFSELAVLIGNSKSNGGIYMAIDEFVAEMIELAKAQVNA